MQSVPTLEIALGGERYLAINDVVWSATPRPVVEIAYAIDGEELAAQACDGLICATPLGSTAYNLSNGGPGARLGARRCGGHARRPAHAAHHGRSWSGGSSGSRWLNRSPDVEMVVLADGRAVGALPRDAVPEAYASPTAAPFSLAPRADVLRPLHPGLRGRLRRPAGFKRWRAGRPEEGFRCAGSRSETPRPPGDGRWSRPQRPGEPGELALDRKRQSPWSDGHRTMAVCSGASASRTSS